MITTDQAATLFNADVYDSDGDKIGSVGQVYLDDTTGEPSWVSVKTGLFGMSESLVPLQNASYDNTDLRVGYDKARVKDAPNLDPDSNGLSADEEQKLYEYYGLGYSDSYTETGTTDGYDTSGPTTDNAMTRSEEHLNVGVQRQEAGRVRLRKYVVTEQQSVSVPVQREEVRIEREPITDANVDEAMSGPAISEEEHEVVLHEEVPVVSTEARPVERVRLSTDTVVEQETVSGEVRKEQIEVDDATLGTTTDTTSTGTTYDPDAR